MANYNGFTRTNYFRVTDEERLRELVSACVCDEDGLELFERTDSDGGKWFGFGAYGSISGLQVPDDDPDECSDYDFDLFVSKLQKILPDDDAIIITEVGYEKLRYLTGYSVIIAKTETRCVELREESIKAAQELLSNPNFDTVTEY